MTRAGAEIRYRATSMIHDFTAPSSSPLFTSLHIHFLSINNAWQDKTDREVRRGDGEVYSRGIPSPLRPDADEKLTFPSKGSCIREVRGVQLPERQQGHVCEGIHGFEGLLCGNYATLASCRFLGTDTDVLVQKAAGRKA